MTRNAVTQEIYVQPGELIVTASPSILHTVLGSCVGMTFQAAEHGIAALCHPMLPRCSMKAEQTTDKRSDTRYVDYAIRAVGKTFDAKGIKRSGVVVKVFAAAPLSANMLTRLRIPVAASFGWLLGSDRKSVV